MTWAKISPHFPRTSQLVSNTGWQVKNSKEMYLCWRSFSLRFFCEVFGRGIRYASGNVTMGFNGVNKFMRKHMLSF
jgi:hypothetical protein